MSKKKGAGTDGEWRSSAALVADFFSHLGSLMSGKIVPKEIRVHNQEWTRRRSEACHSSVTSTHNIAKKEACKFCHAADD